MNILEYVGFMNLKHKINVIELPTVYIYYH